MRRVLALLRRYWVPIMLVLVALILAWLLPDSLPRCTPEDLQRRTRACAP